MQLISCQKSATRVNHRTDSRTSRGIHGGTILEISAEILRQRFNVIRFPAFGSLSIEVWNLFLFCCLYFGIWHYPARSGKQRSLKSIPTLPMHIIMQPGL
jgi:hypothetical protein